MNLISIDELNSWIHNPLINPKTNRKISMYGSKYNEYLKYFDTVDKCNVNNIDDHKYTIQYNHYRINKIDPITMEKSDNMFKFYHKWDPYTGERSTIDPL